MKTTERDMRLLGRLNAFGFMSVEQVGGFWNVDFSTAARRLRKLIDAGLLERLDLGILAARPLVVTKAGCALLGDTIPPIRGIRTGTYRHDALVVDLALALERRFEATFETERQLKSQPGPVAGHLPDGILHTPDGRRVGVELELTQKSQHRHHGYPCRQSGAGRSLVRHREGGHAAAIGSRFRRSSAHQDRQVDAAVTARRRIDHPKIWRPS